MPRRQKECIAAVLNKDFEKLQHVAEEDAWDMHKVAETSTPLITYLTEDSHRIIREITDLRQKERLAVLYTMDAGPTVHLVCTDESRERIAAFAHAQQGCTVFETKVGSGARIV
jgi:diphosphomevalonate decarboxylase